MNIKLVRLENNTSNHSLVQLLLESAPKYSLNVSGEEANENAGKETFEAIPENFEYSNKHVIGVYNENDLVGVIDLLIGYPNQKTAYIGLMLLSEKNQTRGIGRVVYSELEKYIDLHGAISKISLSVVESNSAVIGFWNKMGFSLTGERKPYANKHIISESILMEKSFGFFCCERTSESIESINHFYAQAGYGSKANEQDKIFLCKSSSNEILGAVRFCIEERQLVLRGMYFLENFRGKGLGQELLKETTTYIDASKMDCYAVPYNHLVNFYGLIGFKEVGSQDVPHFLSERLKSYKERRLKVTLIKRPWEKN